MKRKILYVVVALLTFAVGVGLGQVNLQRLSPPAPKAEPVIRVPVEQTPPSVPVATLAAAEPAEPEPQLILDYDQHKFDPYGRYYVMDSKPKEFENFDVIDLSLYPGLNGHPNGIISITTYVNKEPLFTNASFGLITEKRVFFVTYPTFIPGVEYRFDGEFLRSDFEAMDGKNKAVLRGTITKTKYGRKLAEHTFNFRIENGHC
jgi:hypothetical protein